MSKALKIFKVLLSDMYEEMEFVSGRLMISPERI
jgi:hypothetical protein